ncbi:MAG: DUF2312 domain-containing protein [Methylocella sp.]
MSEGRNSSGLLRSLVDRIVRLEEEKKEIAADIKEVKAQAKSEGFDVKVITQMVREALMDESARATQREFEELCEVYRASLGMLDGTPLGDSARKRIAKPPKPAEPAGAEDEKKEAPAESVAADEESEKEPEFPAEDLEQAKQRGRDDADAGKTILGNPYLSTDPRRPKWDEGWCERKGSDGMEIPAHLRRKPKAEKADNKKVPAQ